MGGRQKQMIYVTVRGPRRGPEVNITVRFSGEEWETLEKKFTEVGPERGIKNALKELFEKLIAESTCPMMLH